MEATMKRGEKNIHSWKEEGTEAGEAQYLLWEERTTEGYIAYGLEIRLFTREGKWETAQVADVTASRELAVRLYQALWRGGVTPCTLRDVVEDFLTEDSLL